LEEQRTGTVGGVETGSLAQGCRLFLRNLFGDGDGLARLSRNSAQRKEKEIKIMTTRRKIFTALPVGALAIGAQRVGAAQKTNSTTTALSFPVGSGTLSNGTAFSGGNFVGTLTVTGFQIINGVLDAVATLSGSLLDSLGNIVASVSNLILNIPLAVSGSCTILTLTLGPLDLNLLGLMVHLNQIVLTITAVAGSGNLLGNLLCAVANLLNNGGALQTLLSGLASLLNQILAAL
jgi:hypothetical protein